MIVMMKRKKERSNRMSTLQSMEKRKTMTMMMSFSIVWMMKRTLTYSMANN